MLYAKVTRERMLDNLDALLFPKKRRYTSQQFNDISNATCANTPDPIGAIRAILNADFPIDAETLLSRIASMPARRVADLPASELPLTHPLRNANPVEF